MDELTGKQLTFDNVVVCFADIAAYAGRLPRRAAGPVRAGRAGLSLHPRRRPDRPLGEARTPPSPLKLYTDSGEEMTLNRGKTYLAHGGRRRVEQLQLSVRAVMPATVRRRDMQRIGTALRAAVSLGALCRPAGRLFAPASRSAPRRQPAPYRPAHRAGSRSGRASAPWR